MKKSAVLGLFVVSLVFLGLLFTNCSTKSSDNANIAVTTTDSDSDTISDSAESSTTNLDTDGDATPDYLDTDSDNDGISDSNEAGDSDLATSPIDSDSDGFANYIDKDSDNDHLGDAVEDANQNGTKDSSESSTTTADTDGDTHTDLIELVFSTDANNAADTPSLSTKLVVISPYNKTPEALYGSKIPYTTAATANHSLTLVDDTLDAVDILASFITRRETLLSGTTQCSSGHTVSDTDTDGFTDLFSSINSGINICWNIIFRNNTTVAATANVQIYGGTARVYQAASVVSTYDLTFIVPAAL